ncbi:putative glycolipid-binding domain-containing protein [Pedobacter ghigonis]|uniref:putative glycolipid-binding domain-containing protein n=1 Tax=Pedobacter ghigonis TaxID=2730403 RepID=UPI00158A2E0F
MKTSVIWSGISNHSIEHCLIEENQAGNLISSTIIGTYQKQIYKIDYRIQTDKYWNRLSVKLTLS